MFVHAMSYVCVFAFVCTVDGDKTDAAGQVSLYWNVSMSVCLCVCAYIFVCISVRFCASGCVCVCISAFSR